MSLSSHLEIEIMPGIANDGSEDFPNEDTKPDNFVQHTVFDLKNKEHYQQALDLMTAKAHEKVQNKSDEEIQTEYLLIEMFNNGYKQQVPGRWSHHFMNAAEELKKRFERDNDPEYKEFLRLQKKFS